jgi:hypothetical protein
MINPFELARLTFTYDHKTGVLRCKEAPENTFDAGPKCLTEAFRINLVNLLRGAGFCDLQGIDIIEEGSEFFLEKLTFIYNPITKMARAKEVLGFKISTDEACLTEKFKSELIPRLKATGFKNVIDVEIIVEA